MAQADLFFLKATFLFLQSLLYQNKTRPQGTVLEYRTKSYQVRIVCMLFDTKEVIFPRLFYLPTKTVAEYFRLLGNF